MVFVLVRLRRRYKQLHFMGSAGHAGEQESFCQASQICLKFVVEASITRSLPVLTI